MGLTFFVVGEEEGLFRLDCDVSDEPILQVHLSLA